MSLQWTPTSYTSLPTWQPNMPAALSIKINRWLWASVALSASVPSLIVYKHTLPLPFQPQEKGTTNTGTARAFALALAAVSLLYSGILLVLSHKEYTLARAASESQSNRCTTEETDAEASTSIHRTTARVRQTLSVLMVAVCQSFVAALCLYVGVRVTFLLRSGPYMPSFGWAYADFGLVLGLLGLTGYITFCCLMHEAELETYLFAEEYIFDYIIELPSRDSLDEE